MKIPGSKWFHQRAVTVAMGIPGMEKTSDHPQRGNVHPLAPRRGAGEQPQALRPRVEHAAEAVNAIHARLVAIPPSEMKRPKPSRLRRIVIAVLPCVSPGPMDQVATMEKSGGPVPPAPGRPGIGKLQHWQRDRAVIFDPTAHALATDIRAALAEQDAAQAQHQRVGTPASLARLDAATQALEPWISATHLRELAAAARLQTAAQRTAAYSVSEIDRMLKRLDQAVEDLESKLHGLIAEQEPAKAPLGADGLAIARDLNHAADLRHPARMAASVAEQVKGGATAIQKHFDSALQDAQEALLDAMLHQPPGFAPARAPVLAPSLRQLADRLPDRSAKDAIPKVALLEIISRGLAQVTGTDASRARRALEALLRHPAPAWIPLPGHAAAGTNEPAQAEQAAHDVESLFRLMSKVGRGTEALMLAGRPGASLADVASDALDVRAYWRADQAVRDEASPQVRAWLRGAQQAACAAVHAQAGSTATHAQVGALRAVRQGFLSNAAGSAYDRANQRLRKTVNEWVDRSSERTKTQRLLPIRGKTPFSRTAVKANTKAAPAFGVVTAAELVERATRSAATTLRNAVGHGLAASRANGSLPLDELFLAEAMARFALKEGGRPNATRKLGWRDARALQAQLRAVIKEQLAALPPGLGQQLREAKPRLKAVMSGAVRCSSLMVRLLDDVTRRLAGAAMPGAADGAISRLCQSAAQDLEQALEGLDLALTGKLRGKEDLVRLIEPQIMSTQLRTRSAFQAGGSMGLATPNISAALNALGLPSLFSVRGDNYSRREAFMEIFHPMQGIQLTTGIRSGEVAEGGVSVGPTWKTPGGLLNARATLGGKIGTAGTGVEGVVLRIRREPGRLPQMRENLAKVFRDLVFWDDLVDDRGARYPDPLAALLARNPKLIVADMHASTETLTGELGVAAAATVGTTANAGRPIAVGPQVNLGAKMDRASQSYADGTGEVRVTNERGKVAQQKLVFSAGLTAPVGDPQGLAIDGDGFARQAGGGGGVQLAGLRMPFALGVTRDLAQNYEKVSMTHLDFAGTMDSDHDRYYDSPEPLLSEIDANREVWIQRFMEMNPRPPGNADEVEQYRNEANEALDQFRADALALHATSRFGIYNIHYTMRPEAAPQFETLRALEDLARESGDEARLKMLRGERDLLLMDPGTWRASTLNIFERGRRSKSNGISFGLRSMRHHGADLQIQLTEFPPRDRPVEEPPAERQLPAARASVEADGGDEMEVFFDALDDAAEPEDYDARSQPGHAQEPSAGN